MKLTDCRAAGAAGTKPDARAGREGKGLGERNSRPALAFAAAEFRISLCEISRQEKRCCVCSVHPCVHNRFTPLYFLIEAIQTSTILV